MAEPVTYTYAQMRLGDASRGLITVASASQDTTPPGPVTGLQATSGDTVVDLSWTNPSASDLAGVLIVRGTGVTPNTAPTAGQTYSATQTLGNATVLFAGSSSTFHNITVVNGTTYYYALYAYDTSKNYSTVASISATPHGGGTTTDVAAAVRQVNPLLYYPRDINADGVDNTFCNWFVADVLAVMGITVPRWDQSAGSYYPSYVNSGHILWVAGTFPTDYIDPSLYTQDTPSWDPGRARHPATPKGVSQRKPYGATDMSNYFNSSNDWVAVGAASAKSYADSGQVVVAASAAGNHVAILVPSQGASEIQLAQAGWSCTIKNTVAYGFGSFTPTYYVYTASATPTQTYTLSTGLDGLSFPFTPKAGGSSLFSDVLGSIQQAILPYVFYLDNNGDFQVSPYSGIAAAAKTGYLLFLKSPASFTASGDAVDAGITLHSGWNFVGVTTAMTPAQNLQVYPTAYVLQGGTLQASSIFQQGMSRGVGYFIYSFTNANVLIPNGTGASMPVTVPALDSQAGGILSYAVPMASDTIGDSFQASLTTTQATSSGGPVTVDLAFGVQPGATDGYDAAFDQLAPPSLPGSPAAFFNEQQRLSVSYKAASDVREWLLVVRSQSAFPGVPDNTNPVTLSWTIPSSGSVGADAQFQLLDGTRNVLVADMRTQTTYSFPVTAAGMQRNFIIRAALAQASQLPVVAPISDASVQSPNAYTGPTPSLTQGTFPVTWSLVAGPSGMTINSTTGVVSWPASSITSSPYTITIQATNSAGSGTRTWHLTVTSAPVIPVIAAISDTSIQAPNAYTGPTPSLTQGTLPVTWSLVAGPSGMTINSTTGVVSWPTSSTTGSPYTITIQATNSAGSGTQIWHLTVTTAPLQSWQPLGSGMTGTEPSSGPPVGALTVYNAQLVAGGLFTTAGGGTCNDIASWNGSSWQPLGSGVDWTVFALTVYNGQLVAGGWFTMAGGMSCNGIASWDGSSWRPLGAGVGGTPAFVRALTVYNGQLVAGGMFTTAGGLTCNGIASWNGSSWQPLGSGMGATGLPSVDALAVWNGQLVAGGYFTTAGGVACTAIAAWNGSSWQSMGGGMGGAYPWVHSLTVYNGQLVAGGQFTTAGSVACNYIACWNGTSWQPVGSGIGGSGGPSVDALGVWNGQLVAGGFFTTAGSVTCNGIALWDGSSWQTLGTGMNDRPCALTVCNGQLVAGGRFTTAGGVACNYIAGWGQATTGVLSLDTTPVKGEVFVDGSSWGTTPQSRTVTTGSHTVSFGTVSGYTTPANQTVTVNQNQATPVTGTYVVIPTTGTLSVDTTPVKGGVFVDGSSWGTAPQSRTIATGSHTVSFGSVSGYSTPANQTVTVNQNQTTSVTGTYTIISTTGALSVDTTPVKGEVFVDGSSWGTAPQSRTVTTGSHTVSFGTVSGYTTPANQTVTVNQNQATPVTGTYVVIPTTGTLSVDTTPVKGGVFVDGSSWGTAPQSRTIATGSHTVSFGSVSGYSTPANQTVTVNQNQTTSVTGTYATVIPVIAAISDASIQSPNAYTGPTPLLTQGSLPVSWSLVAGPPGVTINPTTGVVSWPTSSTTGSPHTIVIQATNSAGSGVQTWHVTVTPQTAGMQCALSIEISGSGPARPAPYVYPVGTWATVSAPPAPPRTHFTEWSGDIGGANKTDETITVLMDRDRTITANYENDGCGVGVGPANLVGFYVLCWAGLTGAKLRTRCSRRPART